MIFSPKWHFTRNDNAIFENFRLRRGLTFLNINLSCDTRMGFMKMLNKLFIVVLKISFASNPTKSNFQIFYERVKNCRFTQELGGVHTFSPKIILVSRY